METQSNDTSESDAPDIIGDQSVSPRRSSVHPVISQVPAEEVMKYDKIKCICKKQEEAAKSLITPAEMEEILKRKEEELRADYDEILEKEKNNIKEKFDFVLLNEQTRASYMLREAHRERQEKISALQSQLQCKNLAALMYVMCTERRRSRLEKLRIIRDYMNYIQVLQDILTEGQQLILHLSRGYKTAARVDYEWREKMKKVVAQFMAFIYNFAGGSPESNQYLIDLPKLLKTEAPIVENPEEDPCEDEEEDEEEEMDHSVEETYSEKPWYEQLDEKNRPFVMFGDMAEFQPPERRKVLKHVKAAKTAPKKWKHYAFQDMFMKSGCENLDTIKDHYLDKLPIPIKWECLQGRDNSDDRVTLCGHSKVSLAGTHRAASVDIRGNMGSILKMISSVPNTAPVPAKTELLGARDSMEITSTTKLRERNSSKNDNHNTEHKEVILDIGKRRTSIFESSSKEEDLSHLPRQTTEPRLDAEQEPDVDVDDAISVLGSTHNDSLQVIQHHVPDKDHKINFERVCPMEQCKRMEMDSFMRSLPSYMRASPFTHFEQSFDEYETCSPEQLEMLRERLEHKKKKDHAEHHEVDLDSPLSEWERRGVAVQTSDQSLDLPPCTCHYEESDTTDDRNFTFNVNDLIPIKLAMDAVARECFFDKRIDFDRFKLVGQDSEPHMNRKDKNKDFKQSRYDDIKKILRKHPSLLDIFQSNAK